MVVGVVVVVVVVVVVDRTLFASFDESVLMTFTAVLNTASEAPSMSLLEASLAWLKIASAAFLIKEVTLSCLKEEHEI